MRDFKGIIAYTCFLCFIWLAVSLIDNCPGMDFGTVREALESCSEFTCSISFTKSLCIEK